MARIDVDATRATNLQPTTALARTWTSVSSIRQTFYAWGFARTLPVRTVAGVHRGTDWGKITGAA